MTQDRTKPGREASPPGIGRAGNGRQAAIDARERLLAFAFAASDLLVEVDREQRVTFAAGAFQSRLGRPGDAFLGQPVSRIVAAEDHAALETALAHLSARGRLPPMGLRIADAARTPFVLAGLAAGGGERFCLTFGQLPAPLPAATAMVGDQGGLLRIAEPRLREAAEGGAPARLAFVEVEGLAEATVMLGHTAREELLDSIGATIGAAAPGGATGELGGGRWGLVHGGGLDAPALAREIERLARARAPASAALSVAATDISLDVGASDPVQAVRALRLMVSRFAGGGRSALAKALERDGSAGLARFIDGLASEAAQIEGQIGRRRFRLAYQPVVALSDRTVKHFEALIRPLPSPDGAPQDPQSFVTLAEASGLAQSLDLAVLSAATEAIGATSATHVAVNVSAISLSDPAFAEQFLAVLDKVGVGATRLLIEVTETADIENAEAAGALIAELRRRGHAVCLDDFGAGAAGIRHLKSFQVDYVKIDGQYVRGAGKGGRDRALLAQIVQLCRSSGAQVIAEHVETEAEVSMLREFGVEYGQGYLFGRPGHLPGLRG
ncbi:EAL domain-containing protein [Elioraea sp.]|uniref:EAL domain-containing protein n=1 Tax=Elioraea sp. TaxID=2185103 RepID=UPI0025C126B0|nr:EAL domain-containing protein [Elioraea sp.]